MLIKSFGLSGPVFSFKESPSSILASFSSLLQRAGKQHQEIWVIGFQYLALIWNLEVGIHTSILWLYFPVSREWKSWKIQKLLTFKSSDLGMEQNENSVLKNLPEKFRSRFASLFGTSTGWVFELSAVSPTHGGGGEGGGGEGNHHSLMMGMCHP